MTIFFTTKYWMTDGVTKMECQEYTSNGTHYAVYNNNALFKIGVEAFYTQEEALVQVEKNRNKEIKSLLKKLDKLAKFVPQVQ